MGGMEVTFVWMTAGVAAAALIVAAAVLLLVRPTIEKLVDTGLALTETETYYRNIMTMVSLFQRIDPQILVENSLRADSGKILKRPLGSPKKFPHFEGIMFLPCQMDRLPLKDAEKVDTRTVIGPRARRPLELKIPLIISGMAYGLALSEKVKLALVKAANMAGTAANSGEGPVLPEELREANKYIIQYSRAEWAKDPEILKQADMIEIHIGQGSSAGAPSQVPAKHLRGKAARLMGVAPDGEAEIRSRFPGVSRKGDWRRLVQELRSLTKGVPIGMKLAIGRVEEDLEIALYAGVDFVTLDGAQAATKGTPPILQDDVGLPTVIGLCRAVEYLEKRKKRDRVSLIVSGGIHTPGECLKALALGADAVALGSPLLFASSHTQGSQKVLPWEPPTELAFYTGEKRELYDVDEGAVFAARFLQSLVKEMKLAAAALGKASLKEVGREDLVALDPVSAQITGLPLI
ncbi:MAG: FMN-binding glutamate synthase family protein [Thermoactinomycetaceae bacterium]|jgi:methylamine---glutamate N-methyltransferase subunit C|nr:FMN-binding glutamate synthase family protein [Bacillota bacterium]MBO2531794.1 FMN-binding glutamate synthase family protein [Thermoactinomycetaceae bacterium]